MINGSFIDVKEIAESAGCSSQCAYRVAISVLEGLHRSVLLNGLSGSLLEAFMQVDPEAAYHLGGLYSAIGNEDQRHAVYETLARLIVSDAWEPYAARMEAWENSLTEEQQALIRIGREVR